MFLYGDSAGPGEPGHRYRLHVPDDCNAAFGCIPEAADYGSKSGYFLGIILAITTAIFYSLYLIFSSLFIQKAGPFSASTVIILSSTLIFGVVVGVQGPQLPKDLSGWLAMIAGALISTVLGLATFFAGLKRIDTANAAIVSTFEVVVAVGLAIIILEETISLPKFLGAYMVISAVVILAKSEYETAQATIGQSISR